MNKIALGTAQFGLNYGISNSRGKIEASEIDKILAHALSSKISLLDTAPAYGNAETVIGEHPISTNFRICTKLSTSEPQEILRSVKNSLKELKRDTIDHLLIHTEDYLLNEKAESYWRELCKIKDLGFVKKIGVSSYSPYKLNLILNKYSLETVQIPMSVFDQDYIQNNFLEKLKTKDIEIHARSIFLQGLVFIKPEELPPYFNPIRLKILAFHQTCRELNISPIQLALSFVLNNTSIDFAILGVTKLSELQDLTSTTLKNLVNINTETLHFGMEEFSKPFNWKL